MTSTPFPSFLNGASSSMRSRGWRGDAGSRGLDQATYGNPGRRGRTALIRPNPAPLAPTASPYARGTRGVGAERDGAESAGQYRATPSGEMTIRAVVVEYGAKTALEISKLCQMLSSVVYRKECCMVGADSTREITWTIAKTVRTRTLSFSP